MHSWLRTDVPLLGPQCPLPLDAPFTVRGAGSSGVSTRTLRTLVDRGLVVRIGQGVYAAAQAEQTIEFRSRAVALVASAGGVVTDRTAAWLWGIDLLERSQRSVMPPIQIFMPTGNRSTRPDTLSGERRLARRDITEVGGVHVTTLLRTACDLGRLISRYDALAALDQVLAGGVSHDALLEEVDRFKGYRGVVQLRYLTPIADPRAESVAESALRLHWYDALSSAPELQWWVYDAFGTGVYRLDLALPDLYFAAEYDGVMFHSADSDRRHDAERRQWLADRGWCVEVFTKHDLYAPNGSVVLRLQAAFDSARRRLGVPSSYPTLG